MNANMTIPIKQRTIFKSPQAKFVAVSTIVTLGSIELPASKFEVYLEL